MSLLDELRSALGQWGLESLAPWILQQEKEGNDPVQIMLKMRNTDAYKARFPAMKALQDAAVLNNMPAVNEANYLQMETAYRTALADSGLPPGMFDSADDYEALLIGNVDPTEVRERVAQAKMAVNQTDPYVAEQLRTMYNISTQDLMAYALDPTKNASYIQRLATSATIAGLSQRAGLTAGKADYERYAQDAINQGMGQGQINEAVQTAGSLAATQGRLASVDQEVFTGSDALDITVNRDAEKTLASQRRARREKARFSGGAGTSTSALRGQGL